jgi:hypothetical protein
MLSPRTSAAVSSPTWSAPMMNASSEGDGVVGVGDGLVVVGDGVVGVAMV